MVAAYLVGERGTIFHAVLLGLIVTVTHTGAVILLAWILAVFLPTASAAKAAATVGFVGGFLILLVGLWLFFQRLRNRPDHVHLFSGEHSHSHAHGEEHSHSHSESLGRAGWKRLILLGIGGGLIPCTDAIVLLMFTISSQQLWLGVPLLLAFSAGLAAVLMVVGVAVVYAARLGKASFQERRWFKALPLISSLLVVGIGFWMCAENLSVLGVGRK
jgi:ABC-type nickel/cobalt efflux system permease component RcnA